MVSDLQETQIHLSAAGCMHDIMLKPHRRRTCSYLSAGRYYVGQNLVCIFLGREFQAWFLPARASEIVKCISFLDAECLYRRTYDAQLPEEEKKAIFLF